MSTARTEAVANRGVGAARSLLAVARLPRGEGRRLAFSVALSAGASAAAIGLLATSGYLISRAAQRPQILALMAAIVAVRACGLLRAVLRYGERLASHDLALRQLSRLRVRFYSRLVPLLPGPLRRGSGELLARFVGDVDALADVYLRGLVPVLAALAVIAGASVAAWLILPAAGAAVLCSLALAALALPWLSATLAARSSRRQAGVRARLLGELVESIDGAGELVMCGRARERVRALRERDAELARLARGDAVASSLSTSIGGALAGAGLLAVLVVAIGAVHAGALSGVLLAALAFLLLAAFDAIAPLPAAARVLHAGATSAARVQEIAARPALVTDPPRPARTTGAGALCAHGVGVRYEPDQPWALRDATLSIAPGEHVALLGPSGAGKSTLAELLVRLRDPDAGTVTLDGVDLRELAQEELRGAVLLCAQDAHLFNTTVRENLLLARRDASDSELHHALRTVELEQWLAAQPDGLDTFVGDDGELLSGGQRRRVALARALLGDARFVILDEPSAHLDAPLARRVIAGVLDALCERGVLLITHDPELAAGCERVVLLEEARS